MAWLRLWLESNRWRLIWLSVLTISGFYSKFHVGWFQDWVNDSLGGVLYVVFWCAVWDLISHRFGAGVIAGSVFALTCGLEFLQGVRHPILEWAHGYFIGRTLLGTTFVWSDFFYYAVGGVLGYFWIEAMRRIDRAAGKGNEL